MRETMKYLCENIQGTVLGYTQSDEITLILIDYQTLTTDAWFNYEIQKMCSIAASMATMAFNKFFNEEVKERNIKFYRNNYSDANPTPTDTIGIAYSKAAQKGAMFDARCFNIPKEEVANLIYWRQLDASRNSIQMVGQANFSHKELQNKSCNDIQDMLILQKSINWNDYPTHLKRGACCIRNHDYDEFGINWGEGWRIDTEIPIFKNEGREYIEKFIYV